MSFTVDIEVYFEDQLENLEEQLSFVIKWDDCKANNKSCNAEKCPMTQSGNSGDRNTLECGIDVSTIEGVKRVGEIAHASIIISEDR